MAITWTREDVQSEAAPVLGWTVTQAYNYFGFLVKDKDHTRYSNTEPYTDFFVDNLNAALQIIHAHAPDREEIISCSTVASSGLYALPDYAIGSGFIKWTYYNDKELELTTHRAVRSGEVSGLDKSSFKTDGTVIRWLQEGDRSIRLVNRPSVSATLEVMVATMPPAVTSSAMSTPLMIQAQHKTAPSFWVAGVVAANDGRADMARMYQEMFWRMVAKKAQDDASPIMAPDIGIPGAERLSPQWSGDNI